MLLFPTKALVVETNSQWAAVAYMLQSGVKGQKPVEIFFIQ